MRRPPGGAASARESTARGRDDLVARESQDGADPEPGTAHGTVDEMKAWLAKWPGREWGMLKKLKSRYGDS